MFCICKSYLTRDIFRKGMTDHPDKENTMNDYSSLRKKNNSTGWAVVTLLLCVILSATVLFSRLTAYVTADPIHYIPLTKSSGTTTILTGQIGENGNIEFSETAASPLAQPVVLAYSPFLTAKWFQVSDENTVWKGETDVEIFRVSYENGQGQVTVASADGDKVIAPGTSNSYSFTLKNTSDESVEYDMEMEAYFSDGTHKIPVNARVFDKYGNYYAGTAETMVPVEELNNVSDSGKLKAGYQMPYTLQWEWPFEGDDSYDTLLGSLAVDEDITLTIAINTTATYTPDEANDGESPQTGDTFQLGMAIGVMAFSGMALIILLLGRRRKGEEDA